MRLFRKPPPDDGGGPDESFAYLDRRQAARVRELARECFAEIGVEVLVRPDHLVDADGAVYGLANLMAACHNAERGEREWPALVRRHCVSIHQAVQDPEDPATLDVEEMLSRVYLRVVGVGSLPEHWAVDGFGYGRMITDDLVELLCLDSPQTVRLLRHEVVDAFGIDALRQAGLENLLREPIDVVERIQCGEGAEAAVVLADSVYTSSRVLVLPDLLRRVYGEREYPRGVLVAVPFRHQVALHPVDDRGVVAAVGALAGFAHAGFQDGVGSVSPHLYWWHAGELRRISHVEEGGVVIRADADFTDVLNDLFDDPS